MTVRFRKKDDAPWYADGLRFECQRCGDCCRGAPGFVWVNPEEVQAIAKFFRLPVADFIAQHVRRVGWQYSLKERSDGDCEFFELGLGCRIYPVRPAQCRTFPFWPEYLKSSRTWAKACRRCPGVGHERVHSREEIDARLAEEW